MMKTSTASNVLSLTVRELTALLLQRGSVTGDTAFVHADDTIILHETQAPRLRDRAWQVAPSGRSVAERLATVTKLLPEFVGLHTSGHTSEPRLWLRSCHQLLAEIELIQQVLKLNERPIDAVITFAPPQHIYGFLWSYLLPLLEGLPVYYLPVSQPGQSLAYLDCQQPLIVTIPPALSLIERYQSLHSFDGALMVYSTAAVSEAGVRLAAHPQIDFIEFLGSTETGFVATRTLNADENSPWQLAPDTEFAATVPSTASDDGMLLTIRSPRLAVEATTGERPTVWQMDDYIRPLDIRRFFLEGRRSRLLKMNGVRVNLDAVEACLLRHLPCDELACVPSLHPLRGEVYDLYLVPSEATPRRTAEIRRICRNRLDPAHQPRWIKQVDSLPRSATGKLLAMHTGAMTAPDGDQNRKGDKPHE
jgi:acyl-coenzyme A synthetase/AMP-(fatty) acid ligase